MRSSCAKRLLAQSRAAHIVPDGGDVGNHAARQLRRPGAAASYSRAVQRRPDPAEAEAEASEAFGTSAAADRDLPRNFSALLAHGLLGQTGFRLINAPTFLPHFASELAGAASGGTVMRALQSLGQFLSPLVAVAIVEHRPYAKRLGVVFGSAIRIQLLFLGLIALFVPPGSLALALVWLCVAMFGFAQGMQGVAFQVVMAKVIPLSRRGRLLGLRDLASGIVLIGVSAVGGLLLDRYGFARGNGFTFLLAFGLTSLGLGAFASVREPPGRELRSRSALRERMRDVPALLRAEPDFRRFLAARALGSLARGVLPLYVVWIGARYGISGARLGLLTIVFSLAQSASALGWGLLGDRVGYRRVLQGALLAWALGTGLLLLAPAIETAYVTYALVGAGLGGFMLSGQNLVLEFGSERDRALRIATHNSSTELVGAVGFLAAGALADLVGLESAFGASLALQAAAVVAIARMRDPRRRV
jgi:MFS family permease